MTHLTPPTLGQCWGRRPCVLPPGLPDLSLVATDLGALERLLRSMPENRLYVRLPGLTPDSGPPKRIRMADLPALEGRLMGPEPLHLQAVDLDLHDAGFHELLTRFRTELAQHAPEVADPRSKVSLGVFLSTPGVIAPFHADGEHNFLCQLVGDKAMHLWDREDLSVFPSAERERLACEDIHVLDSYHRRLEDKALVVDLVPGTVLYHPPLAPHWVDTGKQQWSLSISISVVTPGVDSLLLLHKVNRRIRRLGLEPAPVGRSPLRDGVKLAAGRSLRGLKRLAGG